MGTSILAILDLRRHAGGIESDRIPSLRATKNTMAVSAARFTKKELPYASAFTDDPP